MPRRNPPVSEIQLAANRANAVKSTGPRTPGGKARSAQNARKHGFAASTFAVIQIEDLHQVEHLRADLIAVYQPVNSQELFAIERIALTQQAILRAARLETGLFTSCLNEFLDGSGNPMFPPSPELDNIGDVEITRVQNRNWVLGEGFRRCVDQSNAWTLFIRYQTQAERQYRRAIEEIERLKALRPELPHEPILDAQPEVEEPLASQPNEPISTENPGVGGESGVPPGVASESGVPQGGLPPDNPSKQAHIPPELSYRRAPRLLYSESCVPPT